MRRGAVAGCARALALISLARNQLLRQRQHKILDHHMSHWKLEQRSKCLRLQDLFKVRRDELSEEQRFILERCVLVTFFCWKASINN